MDLLERELESEQANRILEILTYYQKTWMKKSRSYQNRVQTILNTRSFAYVLLYYSTDILDYNSLKGLNLASTSNWNVPIYVIFFPSLKNDVSGLYLPEGCYFLKSNWHCLITPCHSQAKYFRWICKCNQSSHLLFSSGECHTCYWIITCYLFN